MGKLLTKLLRVQWIADFQINSCPRTAATYLRVVRSLSRSSQLTTATGGRAVELDEICTKIQECLTTRSYLVGHRLLLVLFFMKFVLFHE